MTTAKPRPHGGDDRDDGTDAETPAVMKPPPSRRKTSRFLLESGFLFDLCLDAFDIFDSDFYLRLILKSLRIKQL